MAGSAGWRGTHGRQAPGRTGATLGSRVVRAIGENWGTPRFGERPAGENWCTPRDLCSGMLSYWDAIAVGCYRQPHRRRRERGAVETARTVQASSARACLHGPRLAQTRTGRPLRPDLASRGPCAPLPTRGGRQEVPVPRHLPGQVFRIFYPWVG